MWLYWCLLSTFIGALTPIAMKKCSDNEQKRLIIIGLFSYNCIMIIINIIMSPQSILKLNIFDILKMLPGVIMQSAGYFCAFSSVKYGKVAITSSIKKCNTVVIFLLGVMVLHEDFTILQIIVSAMIILLSILIAKPKEEGERINIDFEKKAVLYAYGYVLCNGFAKILNKVYVTNFQDPLYVVLNYGFIVVIGVIAYCVITNKLDYLDIRRIKNKKYFCIQSMTDSVSSVCSRFAMLNGNVSVTSVIESSSIVITVLISRVLLKEKVSWKKYLLMFGIFICVFILALIK